MTLSSTQKRVDSWGKKLVAGAGFACQAEAYMQLQRAKAGTCDLWVMRGMEGATYDHSEQRTATKTRLSLLLFCSQ